MSECYDDLIAFHARMTPSANALIDDSSGRVLTFEDVDRRIGRLAAGLAALGVEPGDRVAALMFNSSDAFELQFTVPRLRAIFVPLNWRLAIPELQEIVGQAKPKVLIYSPEMEAHAMALRHNLPSLVLIRTESGAPSEYESLANGVNWLGPAPDIDWHDTWTIIYTSGTTGGPKGVMLTYKMIYFNNVHTAWLCRLTPSCVCASILPNFHIGGLTALPVPVLFSGGSIIVMRKFEAERMLEMFSNPDIGANRTWGVPTNFAFMAELPAFAKATFNHDTVMGVGGAPMPLALLEIYQKKKVTLLQGYGMTEATGTISVLTEDKLVEKKGSVGKPVMDVQIRLVTAEGREPSTGEVGEIWIKGPTVTPGYWANPDITSAAKQDGWLKTGDAMRCDADGYLYLIDRWKDMYISGGENVYPAEVENVIFAMPEVRQVAVIGVPDERWGETGCAYVCLHAGIIMEEQTVIAYCAQRLARYKLPKRVIFIEDMPLNATGKMQKNMLREVYAASLAASSI